MANWQPDVIILRNIRPTDSPPPFLFLIFPPSLGVFRESRFALFTDSRLRHGWYGRRRPEFVEAFSWFLFFFSKENFYVSETLHRRSKFLCIFFNTIPTSLFIPKLLCVCLDCIYYIQCFLTIFYYFYFLKCNIRKINLLIILIYSWPKNLKEKGKNLSSPLFLFLFNFSPVSISVIFLGEKFLRFRQNIVPLLKIFIHLFLKYFYRYPSV